MNRPSEEFGEAKRAHSWLVFFFGLVFLALMGRFFFVQILHGEDFETKARASQIASDRVPARRGMLRDSRGVVLAQNEAHYVVELQPNRLRGNQGRVVLERLRALLHLRDDEVDDLEVRLAEAHKVPGAVPFTRLPGELVGHRCPEHRLPLELIEGEAHAFLFCPHCGNKHISAPDEGARCVCKHRTQLEFGPDQHHVACAKCGRSYVNAPVCPHDGHLLVAGSDNLRCPHDGETFTNQVAVLKSHRHRLPGVQVTTGLRRHYPFPFLASHSLGYLNRVSSKEYRAEPGVYGITDRVGRRGLEHALEKILRGRVGKKSFMRGGGAGGLSSEVSYAPPSQGADLNLTLDQRLQRAVERAFRYYKSGAAVVIDPRTGAILAIHSKPGFDSNIWSGRLSSAEWARTSKNPYSPMIHKALSAYHPGSVHKIVTAAAGLDMGKVTEDFTMYCQGHYDFAKRRFHCHNRSGHGSVTLREALKYSCDVYFYKLGEMIGMDNLAEYAARFGFGKPTGIEIRDQLGLVPTRDYHTTKTKVGWQPGFTLSTAIGQGSLTASPLQVARSFAALVNGGRLVRLHLVKEILAAEGAQPEVHGVQVDGVLGVSEEHLAIIREGLIDVVNAPDGTASNARQDDIVLAGKTGTAEAAEWRAGADAKMATWLAEDHAWFAAYAPADDPQVVVVVFVEHGGAGSKRAAPIAVNIIRSWMSLGIYKPKAQKEAPTP